MTMHEKLATFMDNHAELDDLGLKDMVYIKDTTFELFAFSFHEKGGDDVIQVFEYDAETGKFQGAYKERYSNLWDYVEDIEEHLLNKEYKQIYFYSVK